MPRTLVLLLAIAGCGTVAAARAEPVTLKARPFALSDVRLLDGPFRDGDARRSRLTCCGSTRTA